MLRMLRGLPRDAEKEKSLVLVADHLTAPRAFLGVEDAGVDHVPPARGEPGDNALDSMRTHSGVRLWRRAI